MPITTSHLVRIFALHGESQQRALITRCARLGATALGPLAEICAGDHPPSIVRWAMEAVGFCPGPDAERLLRDGLSHPAMSVRLHAVLGIRARGERALARYLRPLLRDPSGGIRVNALAAVATLRPRWLRTELRLALADEKPYVRQLATRLLSERQRAHARGRNP